MATAIPPFKVKAIYEYISDHPDDLSFPVTQIITVTAEEDEEWYSGRYFDNTGALREGMFPRNFVEIVVEDESPSIPSHPSRPRQSQAPAAGPIQPAAAVPTPAAITDPEPEEQDQPVPEPVILSAPAQTKSAPVLASRVAGVATAPVSTQSESVSQEPVAPAAKSSFRDRIAAFNVASATPVAPQAKPAIQSFVKKPFVAPAPSAYIPPAPQAAPKTSTTSYEQSTSPRASIDDNRVYSEESHTSHEPIITGGTSLKDRIALLQQMQLEQQAAKAAKAAKKKKVHTKHPSQQFEDLPVESTAAGAEAAELSDDSARKSVEHRRMDEELELSPTSEVPQQVPEVPTIIDAYPDTEEPLVIRNADLSEDTAGEQSDVEDNIEASTPRGIPQMPIPDAEVQSAEEADDEQLPEAEMNEADEDEEEEIDPEVARRIAIRERMAKMSGGMGMPFAIPGVMGMPMGGFPKSTTKKAPEPPKGDNDEEYSQPRPISILPVAVPLPTSQEVHQDDDEREEEDLEPEQGQETQISQLESEAKDSQKDDFEEAHPSEVSTEIEQEIDGPVVSLSSSHVPIGAAKLTSTAAADEGNFIKQGSHQEPSVEVEPDAPMHNRAVPPVPHSPPQPHPLLPTIPPVPVSAPPAPRSPTARAIPPPMPDSPSLGSERPPIPQLPPTPSASHTSHHHLPPPPPPPAAPPVSYAPPPVSNVPPVPPIHSVPVRRSTEMSDRSVHRNSTEFISSDSDEVTTGYEADDDTDLNVSSTHEVDATYASVNYTTAAEPSPASAPPIPTSGPPAHAAPPPPLSYPLPPPPPPPTHYAPAPTSPAQYTPHPPPQVSPVPTSPVLSAAYLDRRPSVEGHRSMDPRRSTDARRSLDRSRLSMDAMGAGTYMASDIDFAEKTGWWSAPEAVPHSILSRSRDLSFEVDESSHSRRGRGIVTRKIYVLYYDYSQSVITVQFERENPSRVKFEQRHEPPPPPLRRDQLEGVYTRFGAQIKDFAGDSLGKSVGDGSAFGFVRALIARLPDALQSAGTRAHGAVVYSNLANASVTQVDEIKAGDIISFRNAKFQGHKGGLHQKYSLEVGKPDHCAVVQEWDGTKRKVKVLEQSKEKGKVRAESYRLGDLKSGEVIVFRVVGRDYVGWDGDDM
ncbi:hypothetical protein V1517DRAFT_333612 [Lipomyces orientalis]|uniref:Uncharacterized protein n=1 Tax=Lipomyces orientalis TaxID=1233043 RepID=A0ACC3TE28_9ASCO